MPPGIYAHRHTVLHVRMRMQRRRTYQYKRTHARTHQYSTGKPVEMLGSVTPNLLPSPMRALFEICVLTEPGHTFRIFNPVVICLCVIQMQRGGAGREGRTGTGACAYLCIAVRTTCSKSSFLSTQGVHPSQYGGLCTTVPTSQTDPALPWNRACEYTHRQTCVRIHILTYHEHTGIAIRKSSRAR